jgi:hypothetical protein
MGYTLESLAADIKRELSSQQPAAAKDAVCRHVVRALTDPNFLASHLRDRPAGANPREILYRPPASPR